jgi:hypothetical protein
MTATKVVGTSQSARPAEPPRKDTDHHHGEDVIEAGNWMPKPMDEAARVADARVGKGNHRCKDRRRRRQP